MSVPVDPPDLIAHLPRLRRYARALVDDAAGADDLVQDTLERACRKWLLWRGGSDLRAWLFTLMHNVHVNHLRRQHLPVDSLDDDSGHGARFAAQPVSGGQLESLALRDLQAALVRLPAAQREVLLLIGLEEFSYAEAAGVLGVPVGTVMSRLSRARAAMREALATPAARPGPPPGWKVVK